MLSASASSGAGAAMLDPAAGALAVLLACTLGMTAATVGSYRPEVLMEHRRLLVNAGVTAVAAFPIGLAASEIVHVTLTHAYLLWFAELVLIWAACMIALRTAIGAALRRKLFTRRVLVVGDPARAASAAAQRSSLYDVVGPAGFGDGTDAGAPLLSAARLRAAGIWGVVVAGEGRATAPVADLLGCKLSGVRVLNEVQFWERHLGRINLDAVSPDWMVYADGFTSGRLEAAVRRLGDVAISLGMLLFTLPLMLAVAALIKLDSPGPVFYRQQRIGLNGHPFTLWKFRSMRADAESAGVRWASQRDSRITRVGGFIRTTRIDELPQLINVLRGEMGFVGPRPERPHFIAELSRAIPFYGERSRVKPGITGWAQVNFPYGASVEDAREKLSYDLYYVKNRSLFLDMLIILSTVRVILFQEGAR